MLLVGGLVFGFMFVYQPLRELRQGADVIRLSLTATGLTPLALGLGLFYAILGERGVPILGSPQNPSRLGWVVSTLLALAGVGLYLWLRQKVLG